MYPKTHISAVYRSVAVSIFQSVPISPKIALSIPVSVVPIPSSASLLHVSVDLPVPGGSCDRSHTTHGSHAAGILPHGMCDPSWLGCVEFWQEDEEWKVKYILLLVTQRHTQSTHLQRWNLPRPHSQNRLHLLSCPIACDLGGYPEVPPPLKQLHNTPQGGMTVMLGNLLPRNARTVSGPPLERPALRLPSLSPCTATFPTSLSVKAGLGSFFGDPLTGSASILSAPVCRQ